MEELWKSWSVNEKYTISTLGRVKSFREDPNGKMVSIQYRKDGYCKVSLIDDSKDIYEHGRHVNPFLHVLVAKTWIPNPNNLPEVNHLDRIKSNCEASNLEWTTHRDNIKHSFLTRKMPSGENHWNYGKKCSLERRRKMSEEKLGENHPKFKGWYKHTQVIDGHQTSKVFPSANMAGKTLGLTPRSIIAWAKDGKKGWAFIPKDQTVKNIELEITNNLCAVDTTQNQMPTPS